jgi:hypothetical protein
MERTLFLSGLSGAIFSSVKLFWFFKQPCFPAFRTREFAQGTSISERYQVDMSSDD